MARMLVLMVVVIFLGVVLSHKRSRVLSARSPYRNSLDSCLTTEQLSRALEDSQRLRQQISLR